MLEKVINCRNCGLCCQNVTIKVNREELGRVLGQDWFDKVQREDRSGRRGGNRNANVVVENCWFGTYKISFAGPCPQFDEKTKMCKIYANRPGHCRNFELGGVGCLDRRLKGIL